MSTRAHLFDVPDPVLCLILSHVHEYAVVTTVRLTCKRFARIVRDMLVLDRLRIEPLLRKTHAPNWLAHIYGVRHLNVDFGQNSNWLRFGNFDGGPSDKHLTAMTCLSLRPHSAYLQGSLPEGKIPSLQATEWLAKTFAPPQLLRGRYVRCIHLAADDTRGVLAMAARCNAIRTVHLKDATVDGVRLDFNPAVRKIELVDAAHFHRADVSPMLQLQHLVHLDLSHVSLSATSLIMISKMQMQTLILNHAKIANLAVDRHDGGHFKYADYAVADHIAVLKQAPRLKHLEIAAFAEETWEQHEFSLLSFTCFDWRSAPMLVHLDISRNLMADKNFAHLACFVNLEALIIEDANDHDDDGAFDISDDDIARGLGGARSLKHIKWSNMRGFDGSCFDSLADLVTVDLKGTDFKRIDILAMHGSELQSLCISGCTYVDDMPADTVKRSLRGMPKLRRLQIHHWLASDDYFAHLDNVTHLTISGLGWGHPHPDWGCVTELTLATLKRFPKLERVDLPAMSSCGCTTADINDYIATRHAGFEVSQEQVYRCPIVYVVQGPWAMQPPF